MHHPPSSSTVAADRRCRSSRCQRGRPGTLSPRGFKLLSAVAAAFGYGSWAFYVNGSAGFTIAASAAGAQGSYSFVLTLMLALLIEQLHRMLGNSRPAKLTTLAISWGGLFSVAYGIQWLVGSPDILLTILPGWLVGCVYTAIYRDRLERGAVRLTDRKA